MIVDQRFGVWFFDKDLHTPNTSLLVVYGDTIESDSSGGELKKGMAVINCHSPQIPQTRRVTMKWKVSVSKWQLTHITVEAATGAQAKMLAADKAEEMLKDDTLWGTACFQIDDADIAPEDAPKE
jgi:hypothetical protein